MFKKSVLFLCALAFLAFSCNKDDDETLGTSTVDDNKITAKVENGSTYNSVFNTIKALSDVDEDCSGSNGCFFTGTEIATGSYADGGFTLNLPATVDDKYLNKVTDVMEGNELKVSDKNAKIATIEFIQGYDKSGAAVDVFYFEKVDGKTATQSVYVYADRDVTITGTDEYDTVNNISLKKGWNMVYSIYGPDIDELTTKAVSGLKWYRGEDSLVR